MYLAHDYRIIISKMKNLARLISIEIIFLPRRSIDDVDRISRSVPFNVTLTRRDIDLPAVRNTRLLDDDDGSGGDRLARGFVGKEFSKNWPARPR